MAEDKRKTKILCVRVTPAMWAQLEKAANLDRRTFSDYVRILLEDALDEQDKETTDGRTDQETG